MGKYRKKPVVVEAVRYAGKGNIRGGVPEWLWRAFEDGTWHSPSGVIDVLIIRTMEGSMGVSPGDWIVRGAKGDLYPIKDSIFQETYEEVEEIG